MAFDAATPNFAPAPVAPASRRSLPVVAGGEISMLDRTVLTLGYTAFGAAAGGVAALMLGRLAPEVVTVLAAAPVIVGIVVATRSVAMINAWAMPLLVLVIAAALASPVSVFLLSSASWLDAAAAVFIGTLLLVSLAFCGRFAAAFAVAMLGMLLAAPMGAAAVVWAFGR